MKTAVLFKMRLISLLCTAATNLALSDPRGLAFQASERIRMGAGPMKYLPTRFLRKWGVGKPSAARAAIDDGHLTRGVREIATEGRAANQWDLHLAIRTLERIFQLESTVPAYRGSSSKIAGQRVLHFLTNSEPFTNSGYAVRTAHVLASQKIHGIEVLGITRLGYPVQIGKLPSSVRQTANGITYKRLLPWLYPSSLERRRTAAVRMLVEEARDFGATAIHTTTDYTNAIVAADAARQLGIPWVYEVRGELESTWLSRIPEERRQEAESSEFYQLARSMETRCMKAAAAVVALSEVSRQQLISRGVPAEKIVVVPNAVDDTIIGREFEQEAIRRELGLPIHATLVGSVTAVVDYEGLDGLLQSLTLLPENWMVLIVGDGTARPDLEALAADLGVSKRVVFAGRQPSADIWRWYAALDVFALPRKDSRVTRTVTPIKPLTAMALGIPVVASDLPALREVTGDRALYVPAEHPEELARGIVTAFGSDQSGPGWAKERTWRANGQRYLELYDSL